MALGAVSGGVRALGQWTHPGQGRLRSVVEYPKRGFKKRYSLTRQMREQGETCIVLSFVLVTESSSNLVFTIRSCHVTCPCSTTRPYFYLHLKSSSPTDLFAARALVRLNLSVAPALHIWFLMVHGALTIGLRGRPQESAELESKMRGYDKKFSATYF